MNGIDDEFLELQGMFHDVSHVYTYCDDGGGGERCDPRFTCPPLGPRPNACITNVPEKQGGS